jgi:translocation and assembly module TamB
MVSQLALPELAALIPNLPLTLKSGLVDSNLQINLPSLEADRRNRRSRKF